jgi:hypothetical protein
MRGHFLAQITKDYQSDEGFDLITACDCVHDWQSVDARSDARHATGEPRICSCAALCIIKITAQLGNKKPFRGIRTRRSTASSMLTHDV